MTSVVHFTVSMWNRLEHLRLLLDDLKVIYEKDDQIALHVCAFPSEDATPELLGQLLSQAAFPTEFIQHSGAPGIGLGHSAASLSVPDDHIVAVIAVDLAMPPDMTKRIRTHTVQGERFYYPLMGQMGEDGEIHYGKIGSAILGVYKSDLSGAGLVRPMRSHWGKGDTKTAHAPDRTTPTALIEKGVAADRPEEKDLYCRFHSRSLTNPFYCTLRNRTSFPPWFVVYDEEGKEVSRRITSDGS